MSTRTLKVLTSCLILLGVGVLVAWTAVVGLPPKDGSIEEKRAYVMRGLVGATTLVVSTVGAGIGAFFLMRRARDEYRAESMANLKNLLEQTREDQLRKAQEEHANENS